MPPVALRAPSARPIEKYPSMLARRLELVQELRHLAGAVRLEHDADRGDNLPAVRDRNSDRARAEAHLIDRDRVSLLTNEGELRRKRRGFGLGLGGRMLELAFEVRLAEPARLVREQDAADAQRTRCRLKRGMDRGGAGDRTGGGRRVGGGAGCRVGGKARAAGSAAERARLSAGSIDTLVMGQG